MSSVTEDPGVSSILLFQRQRHKLSATTVGKRRTANEGPVKIQYLCLDPIYVFPEMKLLFPKQNYNVLSPSSYTHL